MGFEKITNWLYIVLFLHQTTTAQLCVDWACGCISYYSYIKPQLKLVLIEFMDSCISYYSYIKPQLYFYNLKCQVVVYRTIPTSNHNLIAYEQITNQLYIVLFLHQTTTQSNQWTLNKCCISYYSYIKPQPERTG